MQELTSLLGNGFRVRTETMSRRYSMYGVLLVCSVLFLVVIVSQKLTNAPTIEQSSYVDIGRTIQSWANNDVDTVSVIDNTGINDAVNLQRQLNTLEMKNYNYPKGHFNISASSLAELVPEMGGQPIRNLIITTWRSGSTFLGDVLNSHPANFYHYEPLLDYEIVQIRDEPQASVALEVIKKLLNCDYTGLEHYLDYGKYHNWLFVHNTRLWDQCQLRPNICWLKEFLTPFCRLFPFQSMKIVRLRLKLVEEFLSDPRLNVRVLYLVRDPRGTLQSRKHREWCPGSPDCDEPGRLCSDLAADFDAASKLSAKYPNRFRALRYEDLSVDPFNGVRNLFNFFGLDFHARVREFLETHTKVNVGGVSSTYRNSKSAPFHWRQDLTHSEVRSIQRACRPAMDSWGYVRTFNSSHQKEFNPLKHFNLSWHL